MTTKKQPLLAKAQDNAPNDGMTPKLSDEAIRSLTGFFDVLIQMDLAAKLRNERNNKDDSNIPTVPTVATQAD